MSNHCKIKDSITEAIHNGEINNSDLVQIIAHIAMVLNLKTLSQYAQDNGISYNGAKRRKLNTVKIAGITLIIDNE